MKIKNTTETENALFNRKEVEAIVEADITPKMDEALKLIADKYSSPQDNIKIKGVYGSFGSHDFKVIAHVYKTKEDKDSTEKKTKQEKEAEKKAEEERVKAEKEAKEAAKKEEEEKKAAEEAAKAEAEKPKEEETKEDAPKEEVKKEEKTE
jgi:ribosomal protein S24E